MARKKDPMAINKREKAILKFIQKQVEVMGVDGSHPMVYNVWVAENANGLASSHYKCIIG